MWKPIWCSFYSLLSSTIINNSSRSAVTKEILFVINGKLRGFFFFIYSTKDCWSVCCGSKVCLETTKIELNTKTHHSPAIPSFSHSLVVHRSMSRYLYLGWSFLISFLLIFFYCYLCFHPSSYLFILMSVSLLWCSSCVCEKQREVKKEGIKKLNNAFVFHSGLSVCFHSFVCEFNISRHNFRSFTPYYTGCWPRSETLATSLGANQASEQALINSLTSCCPRGTSSGLKNVAHIEHSFRRAWPALWVSPVLTLFVYSILFFSVFLPLLVTQTLTHTSTHSLFLREREGFIIQTFNLNSRSSYPPTFSMWFLFTGKIFLKWFLDSLFQT